MEASQQTLHTHAAFVDAFTSVLQQARRAHLAWMGVMQCVVYSQPMRKRTQAHITDDTGNKQRRAVAVSGDADTWFEAQKNKMAHDFLSLEAQLSMDWDKRRDPRYSTSSALLSTKQTLEKSLATLVGDVVAVAQYRDGLVQRSKNRVLAKTEQNMYGAFIEQLQQLVNVCDAHIVGDNVLDNAVQSLQRQRDGLNGNNGMGVV